MSEADRCATHFLCAGICGHDEDDVSKVGLATIVIGQRAMIHNLQ